MKISEYLKSQSLQTPSTIKSPSVKIDMRKLVVEWIIELCHQFKLKTETLFMSVHLFDLVVSAFRDLNSANLQLLAITVVFISSKY